MIFRGPKYPIIGYKNPQKPAEGRVNAIEGLWEIGKDLVVGHIGRYLSRQLLDVEEGDSLGFLRNAFGNYFGGLADAKLKKELEEDLIYYFPLVAAADDFLDGSSNGQEFYTVEFNGEELTIYIKNKGEDEPADDLLAEGVRFVRTYRYSPYQRQDLTLPLFRGGFNKPGAEFLTNGDYPNLLSDPKHAQEWFVRDEMDDSQQLGRQLEFADGQLQTVIEGLTVRKYSRPTKWQSFIRWIERKGAYMVYDPLFSAGRYVSSGIPILGGPINQYFWEVQYKTTTATVRALTRNQARNPHNIDQRKGQ